MCELIEWFRCIVWSLSVAPLLLQIQRDDRSKRKLSVPWGETRSGCVTACDDDRWRARSFESSKLVLDGWRAKRHVRLFGSHASMNQRAAASLQYNGVAGRGLMLAWFSSLPRTRDLIGYLLLRCGRRKGLAGSLLQAYNDQPSADTYWWLVTVSSTCTL